MAYFLAMYGYSEDPEDYSKIRDFLQDITVSHQINQ